MLTLLQGLNLKINFLIPSTWGQIMVREGHFSPHTIRSSLATNSWELSLGISSCYLVLLWLRPTLSASTNDCSASILPLQNHPPLSVIQEFLEAVAQATKTTVTEEPFPSFPFHWGLSEITSLWRLPTCRTDDWFPPGHCARPTACSPFPSPVTLHHFFDTAGLESSKNNPTSLVVCICVAVLYT